MTPLNIEVFFNYNTIPIEKEAPNTTFHLIEYKTFCVLTGLHLYESNVNTLLLW